MSRPSPIQMNVEDTHLTNATPTRYDLPAYDPQNYIETAEYKSVTEMEQLALSAIDCAEEVIERVKEPVTPFMLAKVGVRITAIVARWRRAR